MGLHPRTLATVAAMARQGGGGSGRRDQPMVLANYNTVGAVHQNQVLQNLLVGYQFPESMFISERIVPVLPVVNESDIYYRMDRSPWQRRESTLVPDRAPAREVEWTWSTDVYMAERYALATSVSDRERRNADDQLRLEESAALLPTQLLRLDQEIRTAELLTRANTSGVALSGDNRFDAAAFTANGVSIEKRFDDAKAAIRRATGGFMPTDVIIPSDVAQVMKRDPTIREMIKYTTNPLVNGDLPSTLWDLRVHIPTTQYTTSPEGTAEASVSYTDIWGKNITFVYVPPVPGIRVPASAYQFRVTADNFSVSEWREERVKLDMYEVSYTQDMKLIVPAAVYQLENAIS